VSPGPAEGERPSPCAAALAAGRLGVLGGSFDPPHAGHLFAARSARRAFALEHVLFVPAARPPHKLERRLATPAQRVRMLELLLAGEPDCSIWTLELEREGPSYTLDTLRELSRRVRPEARLFLILGEDNLPGLAGWRGAEELLRLAQPIVVPRQSASPGPPPPLDEGLSERARTRLRIGRLSGTTLEASSSELRARLGRGEPPEPPGGQLPEALRAHLAAGDLYRRAP